MTRTQILIIALILFSGFTERIASLPVKAFFCDVPASIKAIESGAMVIQFPGYAPFHLAVWTLGHVSGCPFTGAVVFSMLCGLGAIVYCALFAYDRAGFPGAVLAASLMAFSPISAYFSCVGASYTTDLLGMSAVIFHGNRALAGTDRNQYLYVLLWFVFGCLMRSLSFPFLGFGLLYLLCVFPTRRNIAFTAAAAIISGSALAALTIHYYGGLQALRDSTASVKGAGLHSATWVWIFANEIRNFCFLLWSLNLFVLVIPAVLWWARRNLNRSLAVFFLLLSFPYFAFLLWYNCHAGYVCLLLPAAVCALWLPEKRFWLDSKSGPLALAFVMISLLQFLVARPIAFAGKPSLVLNSYLLTYTRAGIKDGMFDNLTNWAKRSHLDENRKSGSWL